MQSALLGIDAALKYTTIDWQCSSVKNFDTPARPNTRILN